MGEARNSASPPTLKPPKPAPWKESQKDSVLNRPVALRASLSAMSMASEPPVESSTLSSAPGATLASFSASNTDGSLV